MKVIENDWRHFFQEESGKPYYDKLMGFVAGEYEREEVFPQESDVFNAFEYTPLSRVKAVILGQDPYHDQGQAHGLAFSVRPEVALPPSLVNIYKELAMEYKTKPPASGCLTGWAKQGVLLLNTILTVRAHQALSHKGRGWEEFTDDVIRELNGCRQPIVFMLWGAPAGKKAVMLDNPEHLVLKAPHPSPLSAYRGFFGCGHFKLCNDFLVSKGAKPIDWMAI